MHLIVGRLSIFLYCFQLCTFADSDVIQSSVELSVCSNNSVHGLIYEWQVVPSAAAACKLQNNFKIVLARLVLLGVLTCVANDYQK